MLRSDGIARRPLAGKCAGVFAVDVVADHELVAGLEPRYRAPHSRWNDLDEAELAEKGYRVLARAPECGVDLFVRKARSLLVFLQGHPEYEADTLAREHRRDLMRFLRGEAAAPPRPPANYYPPDVAAAVANFARRAMAAPEAAVGGGLPRRGAGARRGALARGRRPARSQLARPDGAAQGGAQRGDVCSRPLGRLEGRPAMVYLESPQRDDEAKRMTAPSTSGESAVFRQAMREFAAGVAIVACGAGDARSGCTVTALTSLSLTPPTLLVCLSRDALTLKRLRETGAFSVNLLGARHRELADRFASRVGERGAARFAVGRWTTLATGAPLLADALAAIDCRVEEILERHTHAIVIGAVAAVQRGEGGPALAHWRSRYETLE